MVNVLVELFAPAEDAPERAAKVIKYFTDGNYEAKDLPGMLVNAVLDWLKPVQDSSGSYLPDSIAIKEAELVLQSIGDK